MNDSKERNSAGESKSGVALSKVESDNLEQHSQQNVAQDNRSEDTSQAVQGSASAASTATSATTDADKTARNWAVAAHLSGLSLYLGIPFGNILGPLVIWLIKKDELPYAEDQAKEALNFQISLSIYGLVAALLAVAFIGFLLIPVIFVLHIVLTIVATIQTSEGKAYRYPLTIRLIS